MVLRIVLELAVESAPKYRGWLHRVTYAFLAHHNGTLMSGVVEIQQ